ncbi:DegT/DnrJ/EryC1/StrS family aminotransferase [Diaphorobacter aerolatus]|uniref:DegT/DnrJ/EryC1/StrS family aminotransferase n=1 Tax=Diaphorobacter aerolatus TaxID=1288495 RepID=A0A7H0GFZ3_9BURK|nr:DegT/DnrJ/EryC1/StrS family aminotransferase [Diaphorobacter aerolatus]QNP47209.1 DegT/DnrJ/EryC1/StrS family aminotransferase [Diaphorobacter aerolatus]
MQVARIKVPPTAGLRLLASDLLPWGDANLEDALAQWLKVPATQLECSGTSALVVALRTLQKLAPARNEVIVPAYTCPLVAMAISQCGLQARLCDLSPQALDMDEQMLRSLCSEKTLAIVPTHLGGRVADVRVAQHFARMVGAYVIEDAAQALGARVNGESVGMQGDIGLFSLAVGKGLTTFEGGVLVARDPQLRSRLRVTHSRTVGFSLGWELLRSAELAGYAAVYRPATLDWAYGAPLRKNLAADDWITAAGDDFDAFIPQHTLGAWRRRVGVRALKRLTSHLAQAQARAENRIQTLAQISGVEIVRDVAPNAQGTWPVILLRMPSRVSRDALMRAYWSSGLGLSLPFVNILPDYVRYAPLLGRAVLDSVMIARDWAQRLVAISNSEWLTDVQFERLCSHIAETATHAP